MASSKKRKLSSICGMGNATDHALASILKAIRDDPRLLDDGIRRQTVHRATMDIMVQIGCSDTLRGCNGQPIEWEYADPKLTITFLASAASYRMASSGTGAASKA